MGSRLPKYTAVLKNGTKTWRKFYEYFIEICCGLWYNTLKQETEAKEDRHDRANRQF